MIGIEILTKLKSVRPAQVRVVHGTGESSTIQAKKGGRWDNTVKSLASYDDVDYIEMLDGDGNVLEVEQIRREHHEEMPIAMRYAEHCVATYRAGVSDWASQWAGMADGLRGMAETQAKLLEQAFVTAANANERAARAEARSDALEEKARELSSDLVDLGEKTNNEALVKLGETIAGLWFEYNKPG